MIKRRHFTLAAGAAGAAGFGTLSLAQSDLLRIVVGFPAGGVVDLVAREIGEALKSTTGRNVIIENRPGAVGRLAITAVKSAAPNGNTLLLTPASAMTLHPNVFNKLPYDTVADFAPVSTVCMSSNALAVGMHVPARTLSEFLAWCKANPKEATYASPGAGSAPHFLGAQLAKAAGIDMLHVPYKGAPDILTDLYGGRIAAFVTALSNAVQPSRDGKMRILLTTAETRSAALPDVPTAKEAGFPALTSTEWFGLFAPAATPAPRVAALHADIEKAVATESVKKAFAKLVLEPASMAPADLSVRMRADLARWAEVARSMNYQRVDAI